MVGVVENEYLFKIDDCMAEANNLQGVADAAQLSIATVSKILGGKYKGNTPKGRERVARVLELAQDMGYVANASARHLRRGSHHAVIVVAPVDDFGQPSVFMPEFIFGINHALREQQRSMILHAYSRTAGLGSAQRLPTERFYDGALVLDELGGVDRLLDQVGVPAVFLNVDPGSTALVFQRDEFAAGADITRALSGLGYRRLLVVGEISSSHERSHPSYAQRWAGISTAAKECSLAIDVLPDPWWQGTIPGKFPHAHLDAATAVLAMDIHVVLALVRIMKPRTALASCDDCHLIYETYRELTRVRHDRMALGRMAASALLTRIADPLADIRISPVRGEVTIGSTTPKIA